MTMQYPPIVCSPGDMQVIFLFPTALHRSSELLCNSNSITVSAHQHYITVAMSYGTVACRYGSIASCVDAPSDFSLDFTLW